LWPFPNGEFAKLAARESVKRFLVIELSAGQMVKDVKLATEFRKPVDFYGRTGGNIPSEIEIAEQARRLLDP
jgi:2-oxoglutarate ferredoxin oxidoreductase subunit alpha